jgi:hypothetical protein
VDTPADRRHFVAEPDLDGLVRDIAELASAEPERPVPLTLRTHGYNSPLRAFEAEVRRDAAAVGPAAVETFRPGERVYIGFHWPSEAVLGASWLRDTARAMLLSPAVGFSLILLPALMLLRGEAILGWLDARWPALATAAGVLIGPWTRPAVAACLLGAGLFMLIVRLSNYQRDRYRALHYGVPDLGEFMRDLERELHPRRLRVRLDVVGHSMGCLTLINAFRIMSDYFHEPDDEGNGLGRDDTYELRTLVLCAPDLPASMATPERNNYFLSALRRFAALHVFSSDRDIVLKWASSLVSWTSEPSIEMAGRRLGNVLLVRCSRGRTMSIGDSRRDWVWEPVVRPILRNFLVFNADPLQEGRPQAAVSFHDCTRDRSVGGSNVHQLVATGILVLAFALIARATGHWLPGWLCASAAVLLGVGALARFPWPWARDRPALGPMLGFFADWPAILFFALGWTGWNPHGGYFAPGSAPRRAIARLLSEPPAPVEGPVEPPGATCDPAAQKELPDRSVGVAARARTLIRPRPEMPDPSDLIRTQAVRISV